MNINSAKYSNLSASAQIAAGSGLVYGFIINSNTSGTLKLWDSLTAANNVIMNTYTFAAGSAVVKFPAAIEFYTGLYATIGGTADLTLVYAKQ